MKRNRKGFTLVECVIAIAVITIITAAAISIYQVALRSSERQWNSFLSTVMADNALSCFQSSNSMDEFETRLGGLTQVGSETVRTTEIPINQSYYEMDLSNCQIPLQFSKIRSYETGKVCVLDSEETELIGFDYGGKTAQYTNDTGILSDADGIYEVAYTENEVGVVSEISVKGDSDFSLKITESSVTLSAGSNKKSYTTNNIEKYFLKQGMFLYPDKDTSKECTSNGKKGYLYYYVYDCRTKARYITSTGEYLYVRLYGSFDRTGLWWYQSSVGNTFSITAVEYIYSTSTSYPKSGYSVVKDENDTELATSTSKVSWERYPAYALDCYQEYNTVNTIADITYVGTAGGHLYTDYVIKSASGISSHINYALSKSGEMKLVGDNEAVIYDFHGNIAAPKGDLRLKCNFDEKNDASAADGFTKHQSLTSGIRITGVSCDDANRTILFYQDAPGKSVIRFEYEDQESYGSDKASLSGTYSDFYDAAGKLRIDGSPVLHMVEGGRSYQVVIRKGKEDIIIFTSHDAVTKAGFSFVTDDFKIKEKETTVNGSAITRYYSYIPNNSDYGCFIKVTFSNVVSSDLSVEPRIRIWVIPRDEIPSGPTEPSANYYVSYRKG